MALNAYRQYGYTLIEIIVVLVIIGLVGSLGMLILTHQQASRAENIARRLTEEARFAQQYAVLQNTPVGLALSTHAYAFYEATNQSVASQTWQPLKTTLQNRRMLAPSIKLWLNSQGNKVPLPLQLTHPQLIFFPNGNLSAFSIYVGDTSPHYVITGRESGVLGYRPYAKKH